MVGDYSIEVEEKQAKLFNPGSKCPKYTHSSSPLRF